MASDQCDERAGIEINYNLKCEDSELPLKIILLGDSTVGKSKYWSY